ncbi:hypothetical protein DL98DRAFT_596387 [Cadophora sp. DSE1049]|nr:hypothetical protein DL98DRAFT_596387 [Cadophora sp. DSE1049]
MRSILAFALLLGTSAAANIPDARQSNIRQVTVDTSVVVGKLKNLQGTNNGESSFSPSPGLERIHDYDPNIGALFPAYGIKTVLLYNWPEVFLGYTRSGVKGDPTRNENYNWTAADAYIKFVTSNGAKASINFSPAYGTPLNQTLPQTLFHIAFLITDRYMNGAHGSGIRNALELFEFYQQSDLFKTSGTDYNELFERFAAFSRGVAKASTSAGVGAWGGNRFYPTNANYSVYNPFVSRFYKDCVKQKVPIKAATFHFIDAQFSFDPYDMKRTVDRFQSEILAPAGLPDLEIWATEHEINPASILPSSPAAIAAYNDPGLFASFTLGTSMYSQDTPITQALPWPGFGYGAIGASGGKFRGFFNKSDSGKPIPLQVAKAWKLQGDLVTQTPQRIRVISGHDEDGFGVLAGRSNKRDKVQILLNNYQLDFNIPREITAPSLNASNTAYPMIQENGLLNGESACFAGTASACFTFPQARIRNNTSTAYRLSIVGLPWTAKDKYTVTIQRLESPNPVADLQFMGSGTSLTFKKEFPPNAQHLVTVTKM